MLSPIGIFLTNSSVCEIMQSCFQICFENRLSELLRRTAEIILVDMVQLLFARLPQFKDEITRYSSIKKLTMRGERTGKKVKKPNKQQQQQQSHVPTKQSDDQSTSDEVKQPEVHQNSEETNNNNNSSGGQKTESQMKPTETVVEDTAGEKFVNIENIQVNVTNEERKLCAQEVPNEETTTTTSSSLGDRPTSPSDTSSVVSATETQSVTSVVAVTATTPTGDEATSGTEQEYVNPRGVRFVQESAVTSATNAANLPYGLPCVRELLRFLISLIGAKNSELMISMGLNLITIGLEAGIDHLAAYQSLLAYVRDDLCRNLYNLLSVERLGIYTNVLRVTFLLFESLRGHLKLQIEHFMAKLMEIILSESSSSSQSSNSSLRVSPEQKEITLDFLVQLLRIPAFAIELYLNYDCSLNSTNLFEDLTKLLSKVRSFLFLFYFIFNFFLIFFLNII